MNDKTKTNANNANDDAAKATAGEGRTEAVQERVDAKKPGSWKRKLLWGSAAVATVAAVGAAVYVAVKTGRTEVVTAALEGAASAAG